MSKPTGKLLFAYQTIANLEVERDTLLTANQRLEADLQAADTACFLSIVENKRLEGEVARLRGIAREFAGYFSSDDPRHWELHGLADGGGLLRRTGRSWG